MPLKRIKFLNTHIDNVTLEESLNFIDERTAKGEKTFIATPNVDFIVKFEHDKEFLRCVESADLILTDGKPLIWISRLTGSKIVEKISGSDLTPRVCKLASEKGFSIFILGGKEGVAKKASENLLKTYPNIKIVGYYSPPFGFENSESEIKKTNEIISDAHPDIILVCLGSPKQEKFIVNNLNKIDSTTFLAVGATVDFLAGNVKRAPSWISNIGFEWLYRFFQEPKRLFKRYFIDDMKIFRLYFKYRKKNK